MRCRGRAGMALVAWVTLAEMVMVFGGATLKAEDDGLPSVSFTETEISVLEGDSGTTYVDVPVGLSQAYHAAITVDYQTYDRLPASDVDPIGPNGTLVFSPGETAKVIRVGILGDTAVDSNRWRFLTLTNPTNAIKEGGLCQITIRNDDFPELRIEDCTLAEGDDGTRMIGCVVSLSETAPFHVSFDFETVDGSATAGSDYNAKSGWRQIDAHTTAETIVVTLRGDLETEPDETFSFIISNITNATLAADQGQVTILNDDPEGTPVPQVIPCHQEFTSERPGFADGWEYYTSNEGRITIRSGWLKMDDLYLASQHSLNEAILHTNLDSEDRIMLLLDHVLAKDGFDWRVSEEVAEPLPETFVGHYDGDGISLSVDGTHWVKVIDLEIEHFTERILPLDSLLLQAEQEAGLASRSDVRIKFQQYGMHPAYRHGRELDNIRVMPAPLLKIYDAEVLEGDANATDCTFQVTLSHTSDQDVSFHFVVEQATAQAGTDFVADQGVYTFPAGQTEGVISVTVLGDYWLEPDETFQVGLSDISEGSILDGMAIGTIRNNEPHPVERFSGEGDTFDLGNRAVMFTPRTIHPCYTHVTRKINALPTSTSGAATLSLDNDDSVYVAFTGGTTVPFYGQDYGGIYVASNGQITFDEADNSAYMSAEGLFYIKRVSALLDDLDPSLGGAVLFQQFADRVVVTWKNVPEAETTNKNTFQVELYFDGHIQLAWLSVATLNGLVGLSDGNVPDTVIETDFSKSDPAAVLPYDWNGDGIISIVGDVPPFVNCVYFDNCQAGLDPAMMWDCSGDGILSIVGDVPCFVDCVYFGNCDE